MRCPRIWRQIISSPTPRRAGSRCAAGGGKHPEHQAILPTRSLRSRARQQRSRPPPPRASASAVGLHPKPRGGGERRAGRAGPEEPRPRRREPPTAAPSAALKAAATGRPRPRGTVDTDFQSTRYRKQMRTRCDFPSGAGPRGRAWSKFGSSQGPLQPCLRAPPLGQVPGTRFQPRRHGGPRTPRATTHDRGDLAQQPHVAAWARAWRAPRRSPGPGATRSARPRVPRRMIFGKRVLIANLVFILKLLTMIFLG